MADPVTGRLRLSKGWPLASWLLMSWLLTGRLLTAGLLTAWAGWLSTSWAGG